MFCWENDWLRAFREKSGDEITVAGRELRVSGILSTGGAEDDEIVAPLGLAQEILGRPGRG
jgi:ABC-type lipoprotein release transport system permease subunit